MVSWIQISDLVDFYVNLAINLQDELRLLLTTCNFTLIFYDSLILEAGIMDTELLIYFAFACKINLNIFPLLFSYIF